MPAATSLKFLKLVYFFSYQNVCLYDILDILVSFKYQLDRTYLRSLKGIGLIQVPIPMSLSCVKLFSLTKVLFLHRYDFLNGSVLFRFQWGVATTFQIGPCHWCASRDFVMTPQHGPQPFEIHETKIRRH